MKVNFCICKASPSDCPLHTKKRSKYGSKRTEVDGIWFDSKKEADYYASLMLARRAGNLLYFLRQVPFHLAGGVKYVVDFAEFWRDGSVRYTDVKGHKTEMYKLKKRQVEAKYPVRIFEA